jgi:hypothetical protein
MLVFSRSRKRPFNFGLFPSATGRTEFELGKAFQE